MSNPLDWHKFYYHRWREDEAVAVMDLETIGAFMTLLTHQMSQGDIPEDTTALVKIIGHDLTAEQFFRIWEEKNLKLRFPPVAERWVPTGKTIDEGHWEPCEPKPGRLHNRFLTKVVTVDRGYREAAALSGKKGQEIRAARSLESALGDSPAFDFSEIIKIMPRRKVKGSWEGWEQGKEQLKFITTQEEYDALLAATRHYAKIRRNEDPAYHISFSNWVMKEHLRYVPAGGIANSEPAAGSPEAAKAAPAKYPPEWCWVEDAVMVLPTGDKPPWVVGRYATPAERDRAARKFPDDDTKRRWWKGEEIPEPAAATPVIH